MKRLLFISSFVLAIFFLGNGSALAQEFVFRFTNPAFGGNPLNYSWMLNQANQQNRFQESFDRTNPFDRDPLADFEQSLQRQILSQLTREIVNERFGDVDFSQEGRFEFGEFTIDITPGSGGIDISIFNILTGDETTVTVPNL